MESLLHYSSGTDTRIETMGNEEYSRPSIELTRVIHLIIIISVLVDDRVKSLI